MENPSGAEEGETGLKAPCLPGDDEMGQLLIRRAKPEDCSEAYRLGLATPELLVDQAGTFLSPEAFRQALRASAQPSIKPASIMSPWRAHAISTAELASGRRASRVPSSSC